ncbi:MAG: hypothetical protein RBR59_05515 [Sulfurimonadaceae bacterium]|jgi:fibronectin type 3 domain-containing protein|nr:hypothetical protein [Sulfurimonadaceae bacterium]
MKLWTQTLLLTVLIAFVSGCAATPKPKQEIPIDTSLPVVTLTKNGVIIDMNSIAFEWESLKDDRVEGVYVYKLTPKSIEKKPSYYATIHNRFSTHFVDNDVTPDTNYTYAFQTFSKKSQSPSSEYVVVNTLPVLESVSWIHSIPDMPRSAKIIWRPHNNQKVKSYIVERNTLENEEWKTHATIEGRLNAEFIDLDLKDKYTYKYRIRVKTFDNIVSTPSEIVKVVTKALPKEVTNITATRDLPRRIEVRWNKTDVVDFERYYVYRSKDVDGSYELVAKLYNNVFIDEVGEDAKQFFYRVSVVDKDGLESKNHEQSIQGLTLIKPNAPALFEAKMINGKVELRWDKVDSRIKSYVVTKRAKKGFFNENIEEYTGIAGMKYIDGDIEPDTIYYYRVYGVDVNGIKSEPSIEVELKSPQGKPKNSVAVESKPQSKITPKDAEVTLPSENIQIIEF